MENQTLIITLVNFAKRQAKKYMSWLGFISIYMASSHILDNLLTWMFPSWNTEHLIGRIHRKALKLVYSDTPNLSFDELLLKD